MSRLLPLLIVHSWFRALFAFILCLDYCRCLLIVHSWFRALFAFVLCLDYCWCLLIVHLWFRSLFAFVLCLDYCQCLLIVHLWFRSLFAFVLCLDYCQFFFYFFYFRFHSSLGALFLSTTNFELTMNFLHQFVWIRYIYTEIIYRDICGTRTGK